MTREISQLTDEELMALSRQQSQQPSDITSISDEELLAMSSQQSQPITAGEVARPLLQTAKQIAVGTLGSAGDIAQQAVNLPGYLVNKATQFATGDESAQPIPQFGGVNTASQAVRGAFDTATGGLTEPRDKLEQGLEIAGEIAGGIVGPGAIKTVAQKATDIAGLVGKRALQFGMGVTKKSEELVKAFTDSGVRPTLANITEGKRTADFQNLLGNFPGGKVAIEKAAQGQIDDITKQLAGITKSKGGTIQQTGKVIQEGAEATGRATEARIGKLYDDLDKFIPKEGTSKIPKELQPFADRIKNANTPQEAVEIIRKVKGVPPQTATKFREIYPQQDLTEAAGKFLDDVKSPQVAGAKIPTNNLKALTQDPQIQDVVAVGSGDTAKVLARYNDIIDDVGNISYPRLKTFRSTVGAKMQSPSLLGEERGALKKVYAALSEDMKSAVTAQGGEKGLQAFNKANNNFIRATQRLDKQINPLIKADTPEKVYNMALSGTKQGGSNIKPIMRGLDPVQQDFVRGTVVKRMGAANPGQQDAFGEVFSPNKFLTEWNKLSPEARTNLFTKEQIASTNNLNKVMSSIKEAGKSRQTSNSLPYWAYVGLGGVTIASPAVGVGAVAGANITARMMTNPKFIKWLAQVPRVRSAEIPKHLKVLSTISAGGNAELREDILNYLDSITIEKE